MTQDTIIIWAFINTTISILNIMVLRRIAFDHKRKLEALRDRLENIIRAYEESIERDIQESSQED